MCVESLGVIYYQTLQNWKDEFQKVLWLIKKTYRNKCLVGYFYSILTFIRLSYAEVIFNNYGLQ